MPTPDKAVSFSSEKDVRPWQMQYLDGSREGIICELVPKGDSIKAWKEMVAQQIVFTKLQLRQFVDTWKSGLMKTDPKAQMKEAVADDGSITIGYRSDIADEIGLRKFMKGPDGIYMLAYHVRKAFKNERIYQQWTEILNDSSLVPNPEKNK